MLNPMQSQHDTTNDYDLVQLLGTHKYLIIILIDNEQPDNFMFQ